MSEIWPYMMLVCGFAAVIGACTWLAVRVRRSGASGSALTAAMAMHDEAFKVTSHESYQEIRAQADRKAPLTTPDPPWRHLRTVTPAPGSTRPARTRRPRGSLRHRIRRWGKRR
ncbi:hypothetical protein ACFQVC_09400 [Streptomyces monticola]|uniref:Uncharacterized protein n=1 Tax=Streptomyces monticola TaxID=2666263 RepID=A0ABW2JFF8_9ACTN